MRVEIISEKDHREREVCQRLGAEGVEQLEALVSQLLPENARLRRTRGEPKTGGCACTPEDVAEAVKVRLPTLQLFLDGHPVGSLAGAQKATPAAVRALCERWAAQGKREPAAMNGADADDDAQRALIRERYGNTARGGVADLNRHQPLALRVDAPRGLANRGLVAQ